MSEPAWTLDTLKAYFEALRDADKKAVDAALAAAEKAVAAAMAASEKAISKAETAATARADASNEIRAAMIDQQAHFARKEQVDMQFAGLTLRVDVVEKSQASAKDKTIGAGQLWATIVAVVAAVATIITIIFAFRG